MMLTRLRQLLKLLTYEERIRLELAKTFGGCLHHMNPADIEHQAANLNRAAQIIASGQTAGCCREMGRE